MYCSGEAILLGVTADHGDTDHLLSVVPGTDPSFRVDVLGAGNTGRWEDSTLHGPNSDGWTQTVFKAAALVGCSWRKAHKHKYWTTEGWKAAPGPEGFAANLLLSDTTAHLWGQEEGFFNRTQC